jgi:hypothetical protein
MRKTLIHCAIGCLISVACAVPLEQAAAHGGHGGGSHGHGSRAGPARHGSSRFEHMGMVLQPYPETWWVMLFPHTPVPGPAPFGIAVVPPVLSETEHKLLRRLGALHGHAHAYAVLRVERGQVFAAQGAAGPAAAEAEESGGPTAQPDVDANPSWPRPPGAAGPGEPVIGTFGPGLPGPGQPTGVRW